MIDHNSRNTIMWGTDNVFENFHGSRFRYKLNDTQTELYSPQNMLIAFHPVLK